jgi:MtrB/PioB family decaheme-associated outer membrane protein
MNGKGNLKVVVAALLGTGLAAAPVGAPAQEMPDFEQWQCRFCPFPGSGVTGSVGAAALHVSDDSARFGDFTGLDEQGGYVNAEADVLYRAEGGYAVSVQGHDLGLDSRSIDLRAGRQGSWTVDLSWDELPRRLDDSVRTVYQGLGSDTLTLPTGWVRGNFTSDLAALDANLRDFELGWDRKTAGLGLEFVQSDRMRYEADWTQQTKKGRGLIWGNFLGTAEDLVKPLDYQTDQVDAALIYAAPAWTARLGYFGSFFSNKDTVLTWDNPFTGPDRGRLALAPDNNYQQAQLSGAYTFQAWDTVLNASYARGRMEQNDSLTAYTINPAITAQPLPLEQFDGRADTTAANLRLTARPVERLRVSAEYRFNERDNKSGQYEWAIVQADSFQSLPFQNPLYGFENRDLSLLADYRFSRLLSGAAGWGQKIRKRDYQNVERTEEDSYWARVRFRPFNELTLSARAETASRDASDYQPIPSTGAGAEQNPLLRKYYLTDRDRNLLQVQADVAPIARGSVSVRYAHARDRYNESQVGLVASDYDQISADASLQLWGAAVVTAYLSRDNYDSEMVGAGSFMAPNLAPPNWAGRTRDRHDVHGLGLFWPGLVDGKLDLRADWNRADTTGGLSIENPLGGAGSPFPTLRSKLTGTQLMADYHLSTRWSLNAGWRWEKFSADDWSKDGVGPATIANVLTFGAQTLDYDVNVFMLGFRYNFVREEAEAE